MLSQIGLIIIIIAWIFQVLSLRNGKNALSDKFVMIYSAGLVFLIVDGFVSGLESLAFLNLVVLLIAGIIYFWMD